MGEEKKPEMEKKAEDDKPKEEVEKKNEEAPAPETAAPPPPPPPEEVEMRVFMHCEGCARKVRRSLKSFPGVEEVTTDCRTHKVVVKGKKAAEEPLKVVERVQKKTGRKVDLLSPLPLPKPKEDKKVDETAEKPKVEDKIEEPVVMTVLLKVHMHCEACAQTIKEKILKMKGVQSAESDIKASQVIVKGVFDPPKLVEYIHKRTGKHAMLIKAEPVEKKKSEEDKKKEEKKSEDPKEPEKPKEEEKSKEEEKKPGTEKKNTDTAKPDKAEKEVSNEATEKKKELSPEEIAVATAVAAAAKIEMQKRNEFYYYYPNVHAGYEHYQQVVYTPQPQVAYPPQIFSDENPNACSVM